MNTFGIHGPLKEFHGDGGKRRKIELLVIQPYDPYLRFRENNVSTGSADY